VPPGEHTVNLAFGPTPVRLAAVMVSWLAVVIGATGGAIWLRRQRAVPEPLLAAGAMGVIILVTTFTWRGVTPAFGRFSVLPVPPPQVQDGVWRAEDLDGGRRRGGGSSRAGMVVNVAEATRNQSARISSLSGGALGPDKHVDVRQFTVTDLDAPNRGPAGTSRRQWLYMHPPADIAVNVALPAGREIWFQAALAIDPAVWEAPIGDGVQYQLLVSPLDPRNGNAGTASVALDKVINPRALGEQRRWVPVEADLSRWSGQRVHLTLRTLPRTDPYYDWSGWANPVVVVREMARDRTEGPGAGR
jgi:hypothetical protein